MSGKPILNNSSSSWSGTTILSEADTFVLAHEMSQSGELGHKKTQFYMGLLLPYPDLQNYHGTTLFDFYCFTLSKWFATPRRNVGQLTSVLTTLGVSSVAEKIQALDQQGKLGEAARGTAQQVEAPGPGPSSTPSANVPSGELTTPVSTVLGSGPAIQNNLSLSALNQIRVGGRYLGSSLTGATEFGPIQEHFIPNFPGRMTTQELFLPGGSKNYLAKAELKDGRTEEFLSPHEPGHAINGLLAKIGTFS